MRRNVKVNALATRVPLRKAALSSTPAARRLFPAWIDANEGAAFTAVTPRVRQGLILRKVQKKSAGVPRKVSHGPGPQ